MPKAISIYAVSPGAAALKCETRIWDEQTCVLDDDDFAPSLEIHVFLLEGETASRAYCRKESPHITSETMFDYMIPCLQLPSLALVLKIDTITSSANLKIIPSLRYIWNSTNSSPTPHSIRRSLLDVKIHVCFSEAPLSPLLCSSAVALWRGRWTMEGKGRAKGMMGLSEMKAAGRTRTAATLRL